MESLITMKSDEKKEKLRILVLNSCYSEFLENMVFNASAKVKVVEENLLMISQRSQSHFGAFWKQIPQFIANIQVGGNYKSLVDSLKINDSDRKSSKIPINLEIKPVLMRHTFFNKQ